MIEYYELWENVPAISDRLEDGHRINFKDFDEFIEFIKPLEDDMAIDTVDEYKGNRYAIICEKTGGYNFYFNIDDVPEDKLLILAKGRLHFETEGMAYTIRPKTLKFWKEDYYANINSEGKK